MPPRLGRRRTGHGTERTSSRRRRSIRSRSASSRRRMRVAVRERVLDEVRGGCSAPAGESSSDRISVWTQERRSSTEYCLRLSGSPGGMAWAAGPISAQVRPNRRRPLGGADSAARLVSLLPRTRPTRRCGVGSIARCASRTSTRHERPRSRSTSARAPSSIRATRRCRSSLPRTRRCPSPTRRSAVLGRAYRFHTEVVGTGSLVGDVWDGDLWLRGYGDPTLGSRDLERLAADVAALGDPPRERSRDRRRVLVRQPSAQARAGSRASTSRSRRHSRRSSSTAAATGEDCAEPGARRRRRSSGEALESEGVAVGRAHEAGGAHADRTATRPRRLRAARGDRPLHGARERQLHGRDARQAAGRDPCRAAGSTAAGVRVMRAASRHAGVPLAGVRLADGSGLSSLDRLTARRVVALLEAGLAEATCAMPFSLARGRGRGRHARGPAALGPGARAGDREDGDDEDRVGALRLRPRPVRLRGPPERPPDLDLLGEGGSGPVRDRARRVRLTRAPRARPLAADASRGTPPQRPREEACRERPRARAARGRSPPCARSSGRGPTAVPTEYRGARLRPDGDDTESEQRQRGASTSTTPTAFSRPVHAREAATRTTPTNQPRNGIASAIIAASSSRPERLCTGPAAATISSGGPSRSSTFRTTTSSARTGLEQRIVDVLADLGDELRPPRARQRAAARSSRRR